MDAYRFVTHQRQDKDDVVDPQTLLTFGKTLELFAEAIPGTFIQLFAVFNTDGAVSTTAILALTSSFCTSAVLSTVTSYDWDNDREHRDYHPDIYVYFPSKIKAMAGVLLVMVLMSASNLVCRALSRVLFYEVGGKELFVTMFRGEMLIYLIQKLARGDFYYWPPLPPGPSIFCAVLLRIIMKVRAYEDWREERSDEASQIP